LAATSGRITTFAVSDVPLRAKALRTEKIKTSVERLVNSPIEACHDYTADVVVQPGYNALFAAADFAYRHHFPLTLSPDHIWLTIAQGFAQHVSLNAEALRTRLVPHEGKARIVVRRDDLARGSAENPWAEVFPVFSEAIRMVIGDRAHGLIVSDFSTTGPVERAASEVVLMDTVSPYFDFEFDTLCGIPAVSLEGTAEDWGEILRRVRALAEYDLGWWTDRVGLIIRHFIAAVRGRVRIGFWERLYKQVDESGGPYLSGWLTHLLPYLQRESPDGLTSLPYRNPYFSEHPENRRRGRITHNKLTCSCSKVPFLWVDHGVEYEYELLGGILAVEQDPISLAVRPKVGWAVRSAAQANQPIRSESMEWDEDDEDGLDEED
jgi:Domain of unknown function (DUF4419)